MLIFPEVRRIHSVNLAPPAMPENPADCEVLFQVFIGPKDAAGEEQFDFTVITPLRLARKTDAIWGRGLLVVPSFDWSIIVEAVARLLAQCARPTWNEVALELDRDLHWQFRAGEEADA